MLSREAEPTSRGGWLIFALIWTQTWGGVGRYSEIEIERERRENGPSATTMAALLPTAVSLTPFIPPSYSLLHMPTQEDSTVLVF